MRRSPPTLATLAILLVCSSASIAQDSTEDHPLLDSAAVAAPQDESLKEKSKRKLFFDPEDGAFDFSGFLATKKGFLPVASLITEPAVGYGGTLGLMFLHDSIAGRAEKVETRNPDGTLRRLPPPSISWVGGFATQNGSWGGGLAHMGVWKEDKYRYLGGLFYSAMNLEFYGFGGDLDLPIDFVSYTLDGYYFVQQLARRVGDTDLFLGANVKLMSFDTKLDFGLDVDPPDWFPPLEKRLKSSGVGVLAEFDSRNTIFTPDSGINAKAEAIFYDESLGSDRTFQKAYVNLRGWVPVRSSSVLGMRVDANFSGGNIPFYMLPAVDLRGISLSRYQGKTTLAAEAELRWDVTKRWSLLGFFGSGWVTDGGLGDLAFDEGHIAGGTGFRYLISRVFGIRTGMDFAWSEEDFAFYFVTGTAWGQK